MLTLYNDLSLYFNITPIFRYSQHLIFVLWGDTIKKIYFYSNIKHLIDNNYPSIYSFIKANKLFKQNTIQDYYNRSDDCPTLPKFENVLLFADTFNISLDDLVYTDLSKKNID